MSANAQETELYGEIAAAMGIPEGKYPVIAHTKHDDGTVSGHVFTPTGIHAVSGVKVADSKKEKKDKDKDKDKESKSSRKVTTESEDKE